MQTFNQLRLSTNGRIPPFAKNIYLKIREVNGNKRALPDFLIIGAQKSGTTSLFNYLCQHPRIYGSVPKEIFYFCSHPERNERWYRRHFPTIRTLGKKKAICGEATPISLYSPTAAERAFSMIPHAKLIVILREPAARAVSHYYHQVHFGRENRAVDEVFSAENIARWQQGDCPDLPARNYFKWSDYAAGIKQWLAYFPEEQLLVLKAENMFEKPQTVADQVFQYLDLEPFSLFSEAVFNNSKEQIVRPRTFSLLQSAFPSA